MGEKSIKKEVKKKKKSDIKVAGTSTFSKEVVAQPLLVKKKKKEK